jgi:Protein of unknown function (DUF3037)
VPAPDACSAFSYLILRVVPSLERGERLNVGVVLFCRQLRFLGAAISVDPRRLAAIGADDALVGELIDHLVALERVCDGDPSAGPVAALPQSERFGWLAAPSSTAVQASEVHAGLCEDPAATLTVLRERLIEAAPNQESRR